MKYTYTIENNEVRIFDTALDEERFYQPFDPDTILPWESEDKAKAWAEAIITEMLASEAPTITEVVDAPVEVAPPTE